MSTKNLARTVIEGGRSRWSKDYRRHTLRSHRAAESTLLRSFDPIADGDDVVFRHRDGAHTGFSDKLSPARRWLNCQVGRPWDRVRSELLQRFDTRTTAGRHILFCHVLPWVEDDDSHFIRRRFRIDKHGFLRRVVPEPSPPRRRLPPMPSEQKLEQWLAGRRVGERGTFLFWFTLTPSGAFRQDHRLDDEDARLWRSLPTRFRKHHAPGAPGPWIKVH